MSLSTLLVSVGGIGIVVKLLVDVAKALAGVTGRATQVLAFALALLLAALGGFYYSHTADWPQVIWLGVQAGATAIGIDQIAKRSI